MNEAGGGSRLFWAKLAFAAAFAAVMGFFALRRSPYLEYIAWMPRWLGIWTDHHGVFRNTVGFFAFALVILVLFNAHWALVAGIAAFSTALEVAQLWIPGRVFDWKDIAASIAGVLLAWPLAHAVHRWRRR